MKKALFFSMIILAIASCDTGEKTKPTVTEPIVTEPIVTEPIVTEPIVTEPIVTEPLKPTVTITDTSIQNSENPPKDFSELDAQARVFFGSLPQLAANSNNPITDEKVILGKTLYFDNILSKNQTQSCNTCHNLNTYGVDNKSFSEGNDGRFGERNTPTTLNAALHLSQFWDGREPDVEAQVGVPVLNPDEMAMASEEDVIDRLENSDLYIDLFEDAFPLDQTPISFANMQKAIAAFERKLITPSKFDAYMNGNNQALNEAEKEGLNTFIEAGCTTCHMGPLLGGSMYQKFGLHADYWEYTKSKKIDLGRFDVTGKEVDKYVFKVPSLRNISKTAPYFHDGSVESIHESVAIMAKVQVDKELTPEEIERIVLFMETLTGEVPTELRN